MQGEKRERWMSLCEKAAQEQDPEKLMLLVHGDHPASGRKTGKTKELSGSRAGNGQKR